MHIYSHSTKILSIDSVRRLYTKSWDKCIILETCEPTPVRKFCFVTAKLDDPIYIAGADWYSYQLFCYDTETDCGCHTIYAIYIESIVHKYDPVEYSWQVQIEQEYCTTVSNHIFNNDVHFRSPLDRTISSRRSNHWHYWISWQNHCHLQRKTVRKHRNKRVDSWSGGSSKLLTDMIGISMDAISQCCLSTDKCEVSKF